MKITARTKVAFPRDVVFHAYRDRIQEAVPFLPNVRSIEVVERHEEGTRTKLLNRWSAQHEVPALARKYIGEDGLSWNDRAEWDQAIWTCRWTIETLAMPGVMRCEGQTVFVETPEGTEIQLDGDLQLQLEKLKVPRLLAGTVAPIVEKMVVAALTPNLAATGTAIEKLLKSNA